MNKAEEFRLKTQQHLDELNIAAEEFCNEMLLKFEEDEVAAGLYESSFAIERQLSTHTINANITLPIASEYIPSPIFINTNINPRCITNDIAE